MGFLPLSLAPGLFLFQFLRASSVGVTFLSTVPTVYVQVCYISGLLSGSLFLLALALTSLRARFYALL